MEARVANLANQVLKNTEEWEERLNALLELQEIISTCEDTSKFTAAVWRSLKLPLQHTLKDLRSSLVREACKTLETLAMVTKDQMRPFIREILPTLIEILNSGNKVIQGFIDECITTIIQNSRFRNQMNEITDPIKNSKSKLLREACIEYIHQILINWPPAYLEKDIALLKETLKVSLGDASVNARESARNAFILFNQIWPQHGGALLRDVDPRTAKQLRQRIDEAEDYHNQRSLHRELSTKKKETTEVKAAKSIQAVLRGALSRRHSSVGTTPQDSHRGSAYSGDGRLTQSMTNGNAQGQGYSPMPSADRRTSRRGSSYSIASQADMMEVEFEEGQRVNVSLKTLDARGTINYVGNTEFASGLWIGITLDSANGKNDGSVKGTRYFSCAPNHGLFVRANQVTILDENEGEASPLEELATEVLTCQKEHCQEMFSTLNEELNILEQFEMIHQQALTSEKVQAYMETLEAMIEHRNELCKAFRGNLQTLKEQLNSNNDSGL